MSGDHADDAADVDLKGVAKHNFHVAEATGRLTLARLRLDQLPQSVQFLPRLIELDLSHNMLSRFPGEWVAQHLKRLRVLTLEHNHLYCLEDILALSTLPNLESLNVNQNPMPLVANRIYFLEASGEFMALLKAAPPRGWGSNSRAHSTQVTATGVQVPRHEGFPMLQRLNGADISLDDIATVEQEMGRQLRGGGHKATRKTVKERHYKQSQSGTFPAPTKVPLLRYAIDGNAIPEPLHVDDEADQVDASRIHCDGFTEDDIAALRTELRLGLVIHESGGGGEVEAALPPSGNAATDGGDAAWNTTIQSFDGLANDQRCLVREKSKLPTDASLKDNPFDANVVLDNMIQAERSRRLTQRAVDVLTSSWRCEQAGEGANTSCDAGERLVDRLNSQHTRAILTEAFCKHTFQVGSVALAPDIRDVIEAEHKHMKAINTKLIAKVGSKCDPSLVDTIDLCLSRVRNDNAVENVVKSLNPKHEKRLIQALIDSDQQVVEEEVRRQKIQEHKQRMEVIACREAPSKPARKVSAWQKRNVQALKERSKPSPSKSNMVRSKGVDGAIDGHRTGRRRVMPYETIERVEEARLDTLPRVTTKELLVRCAEIRKQARESLKDLARAKNEFVDAEVEWESNRRDPIELLRRKVKASACEGNEVMIGNQEFIYSAF